MTFFIFLDFFIFDMIQFRVLKFTPLYLWIETLFQTALITQHQEAGLLPPSSYTTGHTVTTGSGRIAPCTRGYIL